MGFFSFLHLPKNKAFNFQPRYYDPIKEDIEQRVQMIKNEKNLETADRSSMISFSFRKRQNEIKSTSINQILILAFFGSVSLSFWYWGTTGIIIAIIPFTIYWLVRKILRNQKN